MTSVACLEIVSAHSPDSDDAFMFYGLATKKVRSPRVSFRHVLQDIETLNRKAVEGLYELSAISYHAYPYVADKYVLMASGSSVGDGYGPMIIATRPMEPEELKGKRIAVPGTLTTAYWRRNCSSRISKRWSRPSTRSRRPSKSTPSRRASSFTRRN